MTRVLNIIIAAALWTAAGTAQAIDRGDPTRGGELADAQCMECHSADAVERNPEWPRLKGQHAEYLLHSLRQYKSGHREDPVMSGQVADLSLQDKRDLASWFSRQEGELYTPRRP